MKKNVYILLILGLLLFQSCMKEFLEIKHDFSKTIPTKLEDYRAILDNGSLMNNFSSHSLGILGGDEVYVRDQVYNSSFRLAWEKNAYIWEKDVFGMLAVPDWDYGYKRILYANVVLDGLKTISIEPKEKDVFNEVKGAAYFLRAFSFLQLSDLFSRQFDKSNAENTLGIPLRLESDITLPVKRNSLKDTYDQIIADLDLAIELLPSHVEVKERPCRAAALALLSRVYLQMEDYESALKYAELTLEEDVALLDYNSLDLSGNPNSNGSYFIFEGWQQQNPEVLFMNSSAGIGLIQTFVGGNMTIDTILMRSYQANDLRKKVFFKSSDDTDAFIGTYTGYGGTFTGVAVDEVYLILAEAACRLNKLDVALASLNALLVVRHDATFRPLELKDKDRLLEMIILERRKELIFRGVRWADLKRLNKDPRFQTTLIKELNGTKYELKANDLRYVWQLPYLSILQSGLEDNPR